jgi:phage repressor protein C with HTH and peptisase S24 domain
MSTNNLALPVYQEVGRPWNMNEGEVIGHNVTRIREERKLSPAKLAKKVGVALYTIQAIESGRTRKSKYLPDIARVLQVPLSKIDPGQVDHPEIARSPTLSQKEVVGPHDLPVYGTTEAGEGVLVMTSEPVDKAERPPSLTHVRDAYGVIVKGDSMGSVVRAGHIVVVNPHAHARREDICVFRSEKNGEFKSTIKEFVAELADGWRVKRYRPKEKEFILKKSDWPECHVVVTIHRR